MTSVNQTSKQSNLHAHSKSNLGVKAVECSVYTYAESLSTLLGHVSHKEVLL